MVFLIFPTQLFSNIKHLINWNNNNSNKNKIIYLIEEPRYFTDFAFHKLKLAYHRASMKKYYDFLKKKKFNIKYIDFEKVTKIFYLSLKSESDIISIISPGDFKLEKKLETIFGKKLVILDNINWLIKLDELEYVKNLIYKNSKYSHNEFYKYQRIKLDILIDSTNKPVGGKWSYDTLNRLSLPKEYKVPVTTSKKLSNKYVKEAINYVNKHWSNNYGSLDNFIYPIDTNSSLKWLDKFLKDRLGNFGPYQDAVKESEPFLFHSVISPMMNIGLLTDTQVVLKSYKYYLTHKKSISIESFEGFIRQVIGWRNYVYTIYMLEGPRLYESNYLKHQNQLNNKFWTGNTGIKPIDSIINKIVAYAYAHHIERLMYLGNFMLICMVDPKEVYKIFMEWTIDAYDWVMIPNVFGMSQYADKSMMTRPYFSSSNYINKMGSFKKDEITFEKKQSFFPNESWNVIWDALYYNFIDKHEKILRKNYAIAQQVKHWDNKSDEEKNQIKKIAKKYLSELFTKNL
jgi:deoxyribodipyrimidine photolyase-related protein